MKKASPAGLTLLLALVLAAPARGGWASLGAMPAPERQGNTLLFRNAQGVVAISVLSAEIIRIRFSPASAFGRDHSYAVVNRDVGDSAASFGVAADRSSIATPALRVTVHHDPFRISFADAAGESLDEDDAERGMAFAGHEVRVSKRLRDDEHVYGLGEKTGHLDKRGAKLGGYSYAMWNSDTPGYDSSIDPIYVSVPFFLVVRKGRAHGIFLDNTFRSSFDVGKASPGLLSFGAEGGELNYYFIEGPAPRQVVERYTALTGRLPLPPRWALGYHQCRYSYYPESRVRFVASNFRERRIPADAIWLDIHYLDSYKPFTWDKARFPDPGKMIADLRGQGFRVVTILDAHPKKEAGYEPWETGLLGDHFVKNPDGSVYLGPVWPDRAERNPGPNAFPDFSKPGARDWWGGLYKSLLDLGVAGIWNDMNEPAVFVPPTWTMPLDLRHDNEGQPTDHREIHNVYGLLMTRSTFEGLARLRPRERPFVLTRATFAGGQRYAAQWPGDNTSTWADLVQSIPMLLGMGLSGLPFVGSDIGGFEKNPGAFEKNPSPELYTRWLQAGIFYPFMRTHTSLGTADQDPWSYGVRHEALNRRAIELRYELLPYIYNVMQEASETGVPALRPLFLEYPEDAQTYALDDEFLLGRDLLAAPVLREGASQREVYLPKGDWYDFWTGRQATGGATIQLPVSLETIPLFVRGGAFLFRQPVVQHTGEMPGQPLIVGVYPASRSEASLYEDDGESTEYKTGAFARRRFTQTRAEARAVIEVGAPEGPYRPPARDLVLSVLFDGEPKQVLLGTEPLPRRSPAELLAKTRGFSASFGLVTVRLPDRLEALRVTIER
jgi:alpha-glucosidase